MKELEWFPPIPEPRPKARWWALAIAVAGDAWLYARGHLLSAVLLLCGTLALFIFFLFSHVGEAGISRTARALARIVGAIASWVFLLPFYALVFGAVRLVLAMARADPLGLRLRPEQASYWQAVPPESQRARYYQRLFTLESQRSDSRNLFRAIGALAFVLLLGGGGELVLRMMGFGHPITYTVDPQVGYYPSPNQDVHRYGGAIHINAFGMRSHDVAAQRPAGTFRILMLGDSTLYGGSYIDQDGIYAAQLEKLLNTRAGAGSPPQPVEVLCMGVNAWGPQHELAYVSKFGIFQANLVMVLGPPDDAYRPRYGLDHLPFYAEGHPPRLALQEFWDHLRWMLDERQRGSDADFQSGPDSGDVMAAGVNAWLSLATLAEDQGALVDFELLPSEAEERAGKADESSQRVLDALLPELARRGIPVSFPLAAFGEQSGALRLYHDGAHLSAAGHVFYAVYLRSRVEQVVSGR